MLASEKLAIAAHLHVLLRRKTGRVTDTEWMAVNEAYAREVVRFSHESARTDGHADLAEWANKLAHALGLDVLPHRDAKPTRPPEPHEDESDQRRYVRGIR